jgi:hypothetical protein
MGPHAAPLPAAAHARPSFQYEDIVLSATCLFVTVFFAGWWYSLSCGRSSMPVFSNCLLMQVGDEAKFVL